MELCLGVKLFWTPNSPRQLPSLRVFQKNPNLQEYFPHCSPSPLKSRLVLFGIKILNSPQILCCWKAAEPARLPQEHIFPNFFSLSPLFLPAFQIPAGFCLFKQINPVPAAPQLLPTGFSHPKGSGFRRKTAENRGSERESAPNTNILSRNKTKSTLKPAQGGKKLN